jgi:hypothetical protein
VISVRYPQTEYLKLRVPRRVWVDNAEMSFKEIGWEGVDWIHLAVATVF